MRVRGRPAFLLIEALIGITLFALFIGSVGVSFLVSFGTSLAAGDRMQGATIAQDALEGVLAIRDTSFASLTAGTHGVAVRNGAWAFSGSAIHTDDGYHTSVSLSSVSSDIWRAAVRTTWNHGTGRSGSVLLSVDLTDWRAAKSQGNWAAPVQRGAYVDAGSPLFTVAVRKGSHLFVGGDASSGGDGLYVFDISAENAPVRVASSFDLGASCRGLSLRGDMLYVLTDSPSEELQVFDVTAPTSLSMGNRVTTYDLPGAALGLSAAAAGKMLYVGARADATHAQFYSFVTSASGAITLSGSLVDTGGKTALAVRGSTVYAADTDDVSELRVIDVSVAGAPRLAAGSGMNLTDVLDGSAVATHGTGVVLGRMSATATEEFALFDVATGTVPASPSPWVYDLGETVRAITPDRAGTYVFAASDMIGKEFLVISPTLLRRGLPPEVASFNSAEGLGRGLLYDIWLDRIYLLTNRAVYILAPS